jgi:hypothetical protein
VAKGQKTRGREPKKPKADKKKSPASAAAEPATSVKPKSGAAPAGNKK